MGIESCINSTGRAVIIVVLTIALIGCSYPEDRRTADLDKIADKIFSEISETYSTIDRKIEVSDQVCPVLANLSLPKEIGRIGDVDFEVVPGNDPIDQLKDNTNYLITVIHRDTLATVDREVIIDYDATRNICSAIYTTGGGL